MPVTAPPERKRYLVTLVGLILFVFGMVALSGPGRIDIVDGQARFEVAKSLALHGDFVVRNPAVWFSVFPGRDGDPYSNYRFPHSIVGAVAILVSDLTGPDWDGRRHFFFALTSAVAAALLACVYFIWFSRRGLAKRHAVLWAVAGILCTPNWYYGTSTFDDIFVALAVTGALAFGLTTGPSRSRSAAFATGLLFGLAFNVKQPAAVFVLPAIVAFDPPDASPRARLMTALVICAGLAFGIAAYFGYELYKFPPGTKVLHAELLKKYLMPYPGHFWWGLVGLSISPAAGMLWYCPSFLLAFEGLRRERAANSRIVHALAASGLVFFGFIASLSFFKGDPAWGPRYLTSLYAAFWLFAPNAARHFRLRETIVLLTLGFVVQILALSVDPERLPLERRLPTMFGANYPGLYFDARLAGLLNRPREIIEIWGLRNQRVERFSWSDPATAGPQIVTWDDLGSDPVHRFGRFTTFRPWWTSYQYMPDHERPVSIPWTATALGVALLGGVGLVRAGTREN
jgi:Dolichyl-phosphate-mannose-protein mannosyltransferase